MLPDHPIRRVMPADQATAVLLYTLAPDKLIGWSRPLSPAQKRFLSSHYARLPVVGGLLGASAKAVAQWVKRWRPDVILDAGAPTAKAAARADRIEHETGVPYVLLDGSIENTPHLLRTVGTLLGAAKRGKALATYADHAISALRGRLLIRSPTERRRVYYGMGADGMETGLADSAPTVDISQAGSINVAGALGKGGVKRIKPARLLAWNPRIILAQKRSFYHELLHDPMWRHMRAVRNKWVYLVPSVPFGWLNDPAGVNRIIGLYWLPVLFYPTSVQEDLPTVVREFYDKFYRVKLSDKRLAALIRTAESRPGETSRPSAAPLLGAPPVPMPSATGGAAMNPASTPGGGALKKLPY